MAKGATSKKKREEENRQNTQQRNSQQREETRQRQQRTQGNSNSSQRQSQSRNDRADSRQTTRREVAPAAIPVLEERSTPRRSASGRNVAEMFPEYEPQQAATIPVVQPIPTTNKGQGFQADLDQRMRDYYNNGTPIARHTAERAQERTEQPETTSMPVGTDMAEKGRKMAQTSAENKAKSAPKNKGEMIETYGEREGGKPLSESAQNEINKLQRRLDRVLQFDDVQNQNRARALQDQINAIIRADNSDSAANIERYLNPEYRLNNYEQKNAERIFDEYLENNPKAKELYNTNDAAMSSLLAQRMSPEEADEYARMIALKNKTSDLSSAGLHMVESMPFVKGLADKSAKAYDKMNGTNTSEYDYSNQLEQTQTQNPLASIGGNMAYQLGQYAAFAPLVEGIPVVGKVASGIGSKFSNPAVAKAVESIVAGQAADTLLDTLPNEVIPDIMEGNWRDLPKDILANQGANLAFNVLGEGVGALAKNLIPSLRQADEVANAVKQEELNPLDMAKQNEIDVNAKVDNVNQTVDEVENLAKQATESDALVQLRDTVTEQRHSILDQINTSNLHKYQRNAATNAFNNIERGLDNAESWMIADAKNVDNLKDYIHFYINQMAKNGVKVDDTFVKAVDDYLDEIKALKFSNNNASGAGIKQITNEVDNLAKQASETSAEESVDDFKKLLQEYDRNNLDADLNELRQKAIDEFTQTTKQADEVAPEVNPEMPSVQAEAKKVETPKLDNDEQQLFNDLSTGYDGSRDWWKETLDKAQEYINNGGDVEKASRVIGEIERLERESKELIDLGGTPTWSMPRPSQQLDGVAARINDTLNKVSLEDETIAKEADNIRKAIDNYRTSLEGDNLDAINQARKDLYNACKRFDTRAKKISLEGYDGTFGKKSFSYNSPQSMGVGSPQKLWQNIADAEENNRRLLSGEEPEDTLGKLLNGETLEESTKAAPEVNAPKAEPVNSETPVEVVKDNEPIDLTRSPSNETKERGTSEHIRSIEDVRVATPMKMEGVSDEVVADFVDNPDMYKVLKNKDTKALADGIYNSGDEAIRIGNKVYTGDVETKFRTLLSEKNPSALPLGHQLAKDYSAAGNHEMAAQLYRDMGQALTESGQFSQAAAINMMRTDPLTALQYAEKQLDAINQQGAKRFRDRWVDMALTEDEIKAFNNIEPGDAEAIKALYDKIGARLGKEYPTTFMEKLLEGRKVAMLFNVRTNVRNFGANVPTLGMRWTADRVEALGQNIAHLIDPNFKITQALSGSGIEGRKLATDVYNSDAVQALLKGNTGKYELPELSNSLMKDRQMFKGTALSKWINRVTDGGIEKLNKQLFDKEGVESGLETIRNATYKALDLGDRPFVKENFIERLGSYIHAQGIKRIEDVPDEAIQTAWEEAMKATYKDNSWAVEMLRGLKGGMEKIPGIGKPLSQAAIPFLQAPGNIAARMVDYSPIKATKGIADIISGAANNSEKAVRQGIEEVSKGLTGTGMIILGMRLKEAGILTTDYSDDKDQKNFEKQNGFKPWALHVGDKYYTYDWAQPFAEPMIIGSLLQEAIDNSDQYDSDILNSLGIEGSTIGSIIGATKEGVKASVNSWFNASPLQGMADLLKSDYSGETDVAQNIFDTAVSDFAGAFVPALVNATAKTMDPTQRNTYDPSNKVATFINQQQAKIPGLSAFLPAKYNTWGEEMTYADSPGESFLQRFLIPGDYGTESNDPIDAEINSLFENTQDNGVFPLTAANKVGDRTLNNREVSEYQRDMGQRSKQFVETFMNSDAYQNMSDIDKVATLKTLYGVSKAVTERDMFDKPLADSSTYKKAVEAYDANGIEGLMNYLQGKDIVNSAGLSTSSNVAKDVQALVESGNIEEAQALAEQASALASYGLSSKAQTAYAERASQLIPGLTPEIYAQTWESFNIDGKGDISQDDMIDFFNQNGVTNEQQALTLWKAYLGTYNEGSSKVPELVDGQWKAVSPDKTQTATQTAPTQNTSNNETGDWLTQVTGNRTQQEEIPVVTGNNQASSNTNPIEYISSAGLNLYSPDASWNKAYTANPNLTPQEFVNTWSAVDADNNGRLKKSEFAAYLNAMGYTPQEAELFLKMYYPSSNNALNYRDEKWYE